jgi:hypothetical protein
MIPAPSRLNNTAAHSHKMIPAPSRLNNTAAHSHKHKKNIFYTNLSVNNTPCVLLTERFVYKLLKTHQDEQLQNKRKYIATDFNFLITGLLMKC